MNHDPHGLQRFVRQQQLILDITETLARALKQSGSTRAELAERLGCSRGFVSQLFAGGRNLTLRTISDVSYALGVRLKVDLCQ